MKYLIEPWEHQHKMIRWSEHEQNLALFWEMGTGKTGAIVNILRHKFAQQGRVMNTLILAPLITLNNWKNEFKLHSKVPDFNILVLNQSGKKRVKTLMKELSDSEGFYTKNKIIITNYEAMQMDDLISIIQNWGVEILVCDESHRCKNFKSKRAKKVVQLADHALYKYILTGTPITNSAMDIFNQFRILDGGATFGKNFYVFRNRYFEDENAGFQGRSNYFPKFMVRPETFSELNDKIYKKAMRVVKSECLDLPPLIRKNVYVEMGAEQKRLYKEMKDEYIAYIDSELDGERPRTVIAQLAITKALRLQQIVSGFAKDEEGSIHVIEKNPRLTALKELLEDLTPDNKVIVWASFKQNYEDIAKVCESLKIGYAELHGGINNKGKKEQEELFKKDPNCRVMIANQGSAGIGINLVEATYSVYYSKDFSLEKDLQSEARNYRGGSEQHSKITRIDIVSPGTIDELINEALSGKQEVAEKILDWKDEL